MNNEEYLQQISRKPLKAATRSQTKLFTPGLIKLFAGLAIAIVLLIVVASTLGQSGARANTLAETLYTRMSLLSDKKGPIATYSKNLYSSDLRAITSNLSSYLSSATTDLKNLLPDLGLDASSISTSVTDDEQATIDTLLETLEKARLNAVLDRTFSNQISLQIAELLSMESELYEKTNNQPLREFLIRSTTNLRALETEFTNFTNSN